MFFEHTNAMKVKSQIDAQIHINEMLEIFNSMLAKGIMRMNGIIENVAFTDVIKLYHDHLDKRKAFLYMPGEIGNENITIIYTPAPGFTIAIESEPCVNYKPRTLIHYN
jgi:hypothetical protein